MSGDHMATIRDFVRRTISQLMGGDLTPTALDAAMNRLRRARSMLMAELTITATSPTSYVGRRARSSRTQQMGSTLPQAIERPPLVPPVQDHHLFAQMTPTTSVMALNPPVDSAASDYRDEFVQARNTVMLLCLERSLQSPDAARVRQALDNIYITACSVPSITRRAVQLIQAAGRGRLDGVGGGGDLTQAAGGRYLGLPRLNQHVRAAFTVIETAFDGDDRCRALLDSLADKFQRTVRDRAPSAYLTVEELCRQICDRADFTGIGGPRMEAEELRRQAELDRIQRRLEAARSTHQADIEALEQELAHHQTRAGATAAEAQSTRRSRGIRVRDES